MKYLFFALIFLAITAAPAFAQIQPIVEDEQQPSGPPPVSDPNVPNQSFSSHLNILYEGSQDRFVDIIRHANALEVFLGMGINVNTAGGHDARILLHETHERCTQANYDIYNIITDDEVVDIAHNRHVWVDGNTINICDYGRDIQAGTVWRGILEYAQVGFSPYTDHIMCEACNWDDFTIPVPTADIFAYVNQKFENRKWDAMSQSPVSWPASQSQVGTDPRLSYTVGSFGHITLANTLVTSVGEFRLAFINPDIMHNDFQNDFKIIYDELCRKSPLLIRYVEQGSENLAQVSCLTGGTPNVNELLLGGSAPHIIHCGTALAGDAWISNSCGVDIIQDPLDQAAQVELPYYEIMHQIDQPLTVSLWDKSPHYEIQRTALSDLEDLLGPGFEITVIDEQTEPSKIISLYPDIPECSADFNGYFVNDTLVFCDTTEATAYIATMFGALLQAGLGVYYGEYPNIMCATIDGTESCTIPENVGNYSERIDEMFNEIRSAIHYMYDGSWSAPKTPAWNKYTPVQSVQYSVPPVTHHSGTLTYFITPSTALIDNDIYVRLAFVPEADIGTGGTADNPAFAECPPGSSVDFMVSGNEGARPLAQITCNGENINELIAGNALYDGHCGETQLAFEDWAANACTHEITGVDDNSIYLGGQKVALGMLSFVKDADEFIEQVCPPTTFATMEYPNGKANGAIVMCTDNFLNEILVDSGFALVDRKQCSGNTEGSSLDICPTDAATTTAYIIEKCAPNNRCDTLLSRQTYEITHGDTIMFVNYQDQPKRIIIEHGITGDAYQTVPPLTETTSFFTVNDADGHYAIYLDGKKAGDIFVTIQSRVSLELDHILYNEELLVDDIAAGRGGISGLIPNSDSVRFLVSYDETVAQTSAPALNNAQEQTGVLAIVSFPNFLLEDGTAIVVADVTIDDLQVENAVLDNCKPGDTIRYIPLNDVQVRPIHSAIWCNAVSVGDLIVALGAGTYRDDIQGAPVAPVFDKTKIIANDIIHTLGGYFNYMYGYPNGAGTYTIDVDGLENSWLHNLETITVQVRERPAGLEIRALNSNYETDYAMLDSLPAGIEKAGVSLVDEYPAGVGILVMDCGDVTPAYWLGSDVVVCNENILADEGGALWLDVLERVTGWDRQSDEYMIASIDGGQGTELAKWYDSNDIDSREFLCLFYGATGEQPIYWAQWQSLEYCEGKWNDITAAP